MGDRLKRLDWKYITIIMGLVSGVIAGSLTFLSLPPRVKANEEAIGEHKVAIASLCNSLNNYIEVQVAIHKERTKAEIERERKQDKQIDLLTEIAVNGN